MADFALRRYHEATKHSRESLAAGARPLDLSIKPLAFKVYTALDPIVAPPDIAELCLNTNGVLRWRESRTGRKVGFRAAPCTGARYHVELYLATAARPDLAAGLYHYSAHDGALRLLRTGDVRGALVAATGGFAPVAGAPIVAVLTSTFWRNAWKYRSRAYRHVYWDGGVILANLLALAAARGTRASVVVGFADAAVDQLVGADGTREASFALVALGDGAPGARPAHRGCPPRVVARVRRGGRRVASSHRRRLDVDAGAVHRPAHRRGDPRAAFDTTVHAPADRAYAARRRARGGRRIDPRRCVRRARRRSIPDRERGRRPGSRHVRRRPHSHSPGRLPQRGRRSGPRAAPRRRRRGQRVLARGSGCRARALRRARLPRRAAGGRDRRWQARAGRDRHASGSDRPHVLRRRGDGLLRAHGGRAAGDLPCRHRPARASSRIVPAGRVTPSGAPASARRSRARRARGRHRSPSARATPTAATPDRSGRAARRATRRRSRRARRRVRQRRAAAEPLRRAAGP